jgi:hypothetical protein
LLTRNTSTTPVKNILFKSAAKDGRFVILAITDDGTSFGPKDGRFVISQSGTIALIPY